MQKLIKQVNVIIISHTILLFISNYIQSKMDLFNLVPVPVFSIIILCLMPLVSILLFYLQSVRQGAIILFATLTSGLIYNIINRFGNIKPIFAEQVSFYTVIYELSFGLLLILEVVGLWITFRILKIIHSK